MKKIVALVIGFTFLLYPLRTSADGLISPLESVVPATGANIFLNNQEVIPKGFVMPETQHIVKEASADEIFLDMWRVLQTDDTAVFVFKNPTVPTMDYLLKGLNTIEGLVLDHLKIEQKSFHEEVYLFITKTDSATGQSDVHTNEPRFRTPTALKEAYGMLMLNTNKHTVSSITRWITVFTSAGELTTEDSKFHTAVVMKLSEQSILKSKALAMTHISKINHVTTVQAAVKLYNDAQKMMDECDDHPTRLALKYELSNVYIQVLQLRLDSLVNQAKKSKRKIDKATALKFAIEVNHLKLFKVTAIMKEINAIKAQ